MEVDNLTTIVAKSTMKHAFCISSKEITHTCYVCEAPAKHPLSRMIYSSHIVHRCKFLTNFHGVELAITFRVRLNESEIRSTRRLSSVACVAGIEFQSTRISAKRGTI